MLESTYLNDEMRIELLKSYLRHEHKKLHNPIKQELKVKIDDFLVSEKNIRSSLFKSFIDNDNPWDLINRLNFNDLWILFHIISNWFFKKDLFNCVGHPSFEWKYIEKLPLTEYLLFETKVGFLNKIDVESPSFYNVLDFLKENKNDTLRDFYDSYSQQDRSDDPIICRKENDSYIIHDGNGRLARIAYLIVKKDKKFDNIKAYVGFNKNEITRRGIELYNKLRQSIFIDCSLE